MKQSIHNTQQPTINLRTETPKHPRSPLYTLHSAPQPRSKTPPQLSLVKPNYAKLSLKIFFMPLTPPTSATLERTAGHLPSRSFPAKAGPGPQPPLTQRVPQISS